MSKHQKAFGKRAHWKKMIDDCIMIRFEIHNSANSIQGKQIEKSIDLRINGG